MFLILLFRFSSRVSHTSVFRTATLMLFHFSSNTETNIYSAYKTKHTMFCQNYYRQFKIYWHQLSSLISRRPTREKKQCWLVSMDNIYVLHIQPINQHVCWISGPTWVNKCMNSTTLHNTQLLIQFCSIPNVWGWTATDNTDYAQCTVSTHQAPAVLCTELSTDSM